MGHRSRGQSTLPGLDRWLNHVFNVMGGFVIASGLMTTFIALTATPDRARGTGMVPLVAGLFSVVTMNWTNFAIDSNFKWVLLAPAALWVVGMPSTAAPGPPSPKVVPHSAGATPLARSIGGRE